MPTGLVSTGWPSVRDKCSELGIRFDSWQDGAGRIILSKRDGGAYATSVGGVVLSIPRQVGKTFLVGAIVFALCLLFPGLTVIWTAHHLRTSEETFSKMQGFARRRKIAPHVRRVVLGSGDEAVEFSNGSRILFGARSRGFGRGFDLVDVLVFDEAQILTENAIDDMVPATNQAPNPLLLFMGTPPKPSDPSEVFSAKRDKALSGSSDDMAYIEFSADEDADPSDRKQWVKANPSYPHRTPATAVQRMRENLSDDSFVREALGIWVSRAKTVFDLIGWAMLADPNPPKVDQPVLAVDVTPDRSHASLAFAGARPDGRRHVEVISNLRGTQWVAAAVKERQLQRGAKVLLDASGPAGSLVAEFAKEKIEVHPVSTREMTQACGLFYDSVHGLAEGDPAPTLTHFDQPALNMALAAARKQPKGDAWVWHRKDPTTDISPLVAVTLALFGHDQLATGKKRTGRSW